MWLEMWLEINQKALQSFDCKAFVFPNRDPAGIRTQDPILKRDVLYQLSY